MTPDSTFARVQPEQLCRLVRAAALMAICLAPVATSARASAFEYLPRTRPLDRPAEADSGLADAMRSLLKEDVLDVWYPRVVDKEFGGYLSNFTYDWTPLPTQEKMIVTQARHVWTTSRAAEFFPERSQEYLAVAAHGVEFLHDRMWDRERGGFVSLVARDGNLIVGGDPFTQGKTAYGNAFAIYALAAHYAASGDPASLDLARRAFRWLDSRLHDAEYGGYFQFVDANGAPLRNGWGQHPPKDQNSSIHLLEAFTELYTVWPDSILRDRLQEMLVLVRDTIATDRGYLNLFFEVDWTPISYRDSSEVVRRANHQLDHVSYGHDVETAFLMLEAAEALGLDPSATLIAGRRMVDHALAYGWDGEAGGFYDAGYYLSTDQPPVVIDDGKTWWAQAEGLNALLVMARQSPDGGRVYNDRFEEMWQYIRENLVDTEHGGWYEGGLDARAELKTAPKATIWKGAYHTARSLMNVVRQLEHREYPAPRQLRLSRLISDGAVLQRDVEVPVWGWAPPGEEVVVEILGASYSAVSDSVGEWRIYLPAMTAGGPHEMRVRSSDQGVRVHGILVGDVWLASGQSNMEWVVENSEGTPAADSLIRQYKVPRSWSYQKEDSLAGGAWVDADSEHVGEFTAVGYYFARALRERLDVPVGIINSTWGGSRIEPWMSAEALGLTRDSLDQIRMAERNRERSIRERVESRIGVIPEEDPGIVGGEAVWAAVDLDDRSWFDIPVPGLWESAGFEGLDGVAWYRTRIVLTKEEAAKGALLGLAMIDDSDITWVNGAEVGRTDNAWTAIREYAVDPSVLRAGENIIAVRVEDFQGGGGIHGHPDSIFLRIGDERRRLPAEWKFMVGRVVIGSGSNKNQLPTLLWNKMIHPLLPFPVRGYIWYQGESNAGTLPDAEEYRELFRHMITSWRDEWGRGDSPFLWAQLASFTQADEEPVFESTWATLRESQSAALALPNTGQAILIDIGDADDIHPRNKRDVGRRLALAALKVAYGEELEYSGPRFRDYEAIDGRVRVSFDHIGDGLVARGGPLRGFSIAGPDRRFVWADARIEGDQLVVWSEKVAEPVAVRYAWANNPTSANLFNRDGLPAAPFRTDRW